MASSLRVVRTMRQSNLRIQRDLAVKIRKGVLREMDVDGSSCVGEIKDRLSKLNYGKP